MKKRFARIIAVMLCAVTILVMTPVAVLASEGYTYNYDWWGGCTVLTGCLFGGRCVYTEFIWA